MTHEDQVALEILSEAIKKIDEELGLEAVAANDRLVIRALIRHATAMAVGRWKDAAAVIENLDYIRSGRVSLSLRSSGMRGSSISVESGRIRPFRLAGGAIIKGRRN